MLILKKYQLYILCLFVILTFTSCSYGEKDTPPEIVVTLGGKKIPSVVGLNYWNGAIYNRIDIFHSIMKKNSSIKIPYFELGGDIALVINGTPPDKYMLRDYILNQDGSPKYTEKEIREIPIKFIDGKGTFKLDVHIAAFLSSNSEDYKPGNTIRGFKLICSWDDNECEYGFIIRTNANKKTSQ